MKEVVKLGKLSVEKALRGDTLEVLIPKFFEKDSEQKAMKKEADKIKSSAKDKMTELNMEEFEVGDLVATLKSQDRSAMNPEKLLAKMKELGHTSAIKVVEVIDETAVEDLIYNGKLQAEEIADCLEPKIVSVFSVKRKKGKKGGK